MVDSIITFTSGEVASYYTARVPHLNQRRLAEWRGACPIHNGKDDNFAVESNTGRWFCHSTCGRGGDILELEAALTGGDFPTCKRAVFGMVGRTEPEYRRNGSRSNGTTKLTEKASALPEVARYPYVDRDGNLLYEVIRYLKPDGEKVFRQCRPDGRGGVIWNLDGIDRVPYRLPELLKAETVYLPEGEKDVHTLEGWGLVASCNPGGSGSSALYAGWADYFQGKHVVIPFDNDDPGRKHAVDKAAALLGVAASIRIVELPGLPAKGDVTDWRDAGGTVERFRQLTESAKVIDAGELSELRARWGLADGEPHQHDPEPPATVADWPESLQQEALYGLAGEWVRAVEPHTEADPAALLVQFLVAFGNLIGRGPHFRVEADRHYTNLFAVIVGQTAKGRKGTSLGQVKAVLEGIDQEWCERRVMGGLSSGEGLIWGVRDEIHENTPIKEKGRIVGYEDLVTDKGETDKRLLATEPEFASVLQRAERETNTLSAVIRQAWDSGNLRILTRKVSPTATNAHISLIGHITRDELRRLLSSTEAANGFANRFLWVCARRSKCLPEGGAMHTVDLGPIIRRARAAVEFARSAGEMQRDERARAIWHKVYRDLSDGKPGLFGAATSRSEAQVLRISCLYALLDASTVVRAEHLTAALTLWEYCSESARFIFGDAMGDSTADEILRVLKASPEGMTRTEISEYFKRNKSSAEIGRALALLQQCGRVRVTRGQSDQGRPAELWCAI
jgi:hypothetical protein